ncbi:hypothetical protein LAD12857_28710 [Lacrimispora amygdalina]|uniref:DUF4315 family protein n=1 Tax=Lacrimispora amygdalina TaxID=253257 RepID=A0ABQ5M7M6_9FIRM
MQNKLKKIENEIARTGEKLKEFEHKLKSLQKEKTDMENLIMIDALRKHKVNHSELHTLLQILEEEKGAVVPVKTIQTEDKENETL